MSFAVVASYVVFAFAAIVFPILFFIPAPYGRHARSGWGPAIPAKLGWVLMEAPSFFTFAIAWVLNPAWQTPVVLAVGLAYVLHYGQRTFVYTARMRADGKLKPVLTVVMAMAFNVLNGWGNGAQLVDRSIDLPFVAGLALFLLGFFINLHSDAVLRSLRAPGEGGYKVPNGGLHRFVASPNYFGEIVEWLGFAIAAQTLAGWAFFVFTCANLVPRAHSHWKWYRSQFTDYPANRRALIPFVW